MGAVMSALVLERRGLEGLVMRERAIPEPGPGEVLVRVRACGVGGTVLHKVEGLEDRWLPRIPGHEWAGEVAAVGPGVTDVKIGQRAIGYYYLTCGRCRYCTAGKEPLCLEVGGGIPLKVGENVDGAFAEYVKLPSRNVLPLPEHVSFRDATVIPDAVATPVHICERVGLSPGQRMLVVGAAGGVGVHLVQVARLFGAEVVGVDMGPKLGGVREAGANEVVDASDPDWGRRLADTVDVAVDFVGSERTLKQCVLTLRRAGSLVVLTLHRREGLPVTPAELVAKELTVYGSRYASHRQVMLAAELVGRGLVRPVISATGALRDGVDMLRRIQAGELFGRGAILFD